MDRVHRGKCDRTFTSKRVGFHRQGGGGQKQSHTSPLSKQKHTTQSRRRCTTTQTTNSHAGQDFHVCTFDRVRGVAASQNNRHHVTVRPLLVLSVCECASRLASADSWRWTGATAHNAFVAQKHSTLSHHRHTLGWTSLFRSVTVSSAVVVSADIRIR